ncbi:MAG: SAF domain-containing protein [Micrococcales bacterium]|nr:SAF domain-containing protein [Micrococcales bacterium]
MRERTAPARRAVPPERGARAPSRRRQARRDRLRRWGAALLAGLAVLVAVTALGAARNERAGVATIVAARDLPAGAVLTRDDLRLATIPAGGRPATGLTAYGEVIGNVTAGPISARDLVTPERLLGSDLLAGQPAGHVALTLPVRGGAGTGLTPGVHVDVYATGTGQRAATDVVVLALTQPSETAFGAGGGPSVTVALAQSQAGAIAASLSALQAGDSFILALRRS